MLSKVFTKKKVKLLLLESLLIVVAVYAIIFYLTDVLDQERFKELENQLTVSSLKQESRYVMNDFFSTFSENECELMRNSIYEEYDYVKDLFSDINRYVMSGLGRNEPRYSVNKREYTLNQLDMLNMINFYNEGCEDAKIYPLLYFNDGESSGIDTQGLILSQFYEETTDVIVLIFDKNYEDEQLLVKLRNYYNVTQAPFIVFGDKNTKDFTNNDIVYLRTLRNEYDNMKNI